MASPRSRRSVLLYAPYHPPAVRKGDRVFCQIRGSAVVTSWSDAPFSWPCCRPLGTSGSGGGLFVDDQLARAVRCKSALAVQFSWGVSGSTVWYWRKARGVRRYNQGSTKLRQELGARLAEYTRSREWTPAERERQRPPLVLEVLSSSYITPPPGAAGPPGAGGGTRLSVRSQNGRDTRRAAPRSHPRLPAP
jgi:hypothetical protein